MKGKIIFATGLILLSGIFKANELLACATIAPEAMTKGVQLVREGKPQEAIVELNKGLADGYNNRGEAYQIAGRWNEAIADYNKATELNPNDSRPYLGRANFYTQLGKFNDAVEELNKSIALNDQFSSWSYPLRAWIHSMRGELDFALADYNVLVQNAPQNSVYLAQRAFVYEEKGAWDQALNDFNQALTLNPNISFAYLGRSLTYEGKGEKKLAQDDLDKVRQMDMKLADQYIAKVHDLKHYGLIEKARKYLQYAFTINPALQNQYADLGKNLEQVEVRKSEGFQ